MGLQIRGEDVHVRTARHGERRCGDGDGEGAQDVDIQTRNPQDARNTLVTVLLQSASSAQATGR